MRSVSRVFGVSLAILLVSGALSAQGRVPEANAIPNWSVPATWSPSHASGGIQTMTDISDAIPFVAIAPCRIADTRAINGFGGQAGGPIIPSNTTRNFQITGSPAIVPAPPNGCAADTIPAGAEAVSFQFTIVSPTADGNLIAWNTGGAEPSVSVLNWPAGTVALGNGTIVSLGATSISVKLNMAAGQSAHLVIDVNGYFTDTLLDGNQFDLHGDTSGFLAHFLNSHSAAVVSQGVLAQVASSGTGTAAVRGISIADIGLTYGVWGQNDSPFSDSAGVFGTSDVDTDPVLTPAFGKAGVRGESATFGVLGFAEFGGVSGVLVSAAGAILAQGRLGSSVGTDPSIGAAPPWAVFGFGDIGATGTKFFLDPHPSDASKMIAYVALEGPEAGTYFRGRGKFERGMARINVPEDFRLVTDAEGLTVQVTPIGAMATVGVISMNLNEIVVQASRNVEFSYLVQGVRANFRDIQPIRNDSAFVPESSDATMPAWLSAGQKRALVQNGTFKADGSINMETAQRLGWDRVWSQRENRPAPQPIESTSP